MRKFIISESDKSPSAVKAFRLKVSMLEKLEQVAHEHNVTVNRLVIECIEYALADLEPIEEKEEKSTK